MLIIESIHIIAVICWFAMLFYLPRLFVYHAMAEDQPGRERFKIMERKLYVGIGTPSMLVTVGFGFWRAAYAWDYYAQSTWFWIKISLVLLLVIYHFSWRYYLNKFAPNETCPSHVYFRIYNELPVIALVAIIFLVVLKQPV